MTSTPYVWFVLGVVVLGVVLTAVAEARHWEPPLSLTLAVGAALRVPTLVLASRQSFQPYDFQHDFPAAAINVLHHVDPILNARPTGWNYSPFYAYVLAGQWWAARALEVAWPIAGRIVPVAADLGLIVAIASLASGHQRRRAFQYACAPVAILVSAAHGQFEPLTLLLAATGFVVARRRPAVGGALLGLAIAAKNWPVILIPALMASARTRHQRLLIAATSVTVPAVLVLTSPLTVGTPLSNMREVLHRIVGYRSVIGTWGWTAWSSHILGSEAALRDQLAWSAWGGRATLVLLVISYVLWRRADPVDMAAAVVLVFLISTPGFGAQYLAWPLPFLVAKGRPSALIAMSVAGVWAALGYTLLVHDGLGSWYTNWELWSVLVIGLLIVALIRTPTRRDARPNRGAADGTTDPSPRNGVGTPSR